MEDAIDSDIELEFAMSQIIDDKDFGSGSTIEYEMSQVDFSYFCSLSGAEFNNNTFN